MEFNSGIISLAREAYARFSPPLYLYDLTILEQNLADLRQALPGFKVRYAVKTNPNPHILQWFLNHIESVDVSSAGELTHVQQYGWQTRNIEFTGPAKTVEDLAQAVDQGVHSIVVEDISEAKSLNDIAASRGTKARILVRISPALSEKKFGVRLAGRATQFGVDEEQLEETLAQLKTLKNLDLQGFHIYSGSQCLDDEAMCEHFLGLWELFKKAMHLWGEPISELVFGAGMGIPYHDNDTPLSLARLDTIAEQIQQELAAQNLTLDLFVEVGRFLVGTAGVYLTEVVRTKVSRGQPIAICNGGMNQNSGACGHLGGISHRHYSMQCLTDNTESNNQDHLDYKITGPLCTAIDTLAHKISLPELTPGAVLAVGCAGAYGPSASPLFFISHQLPKEICVERTGDTTHWIDASWLPTQGSCL